MKKIKSTIFYGVTLLMTISVLATSCTKDEDTPKLKEKVETKTVSQKDVSDYTKWYYFSFATGKFVGEGSAKPEDGDDAAWKKRTDWDIAFHRNNVRTNSGISGNGQAGAMKLDTEDFDAVEMVTDNTFVIDAEGLVIYSMSSMPPLKVKSTVNALLDKYAEHSHTKMSWYMAKKNVFIVKTADGKYAKLQFINFLNDKDKSGFLTFKYVYQPDGSTKF